MKVFVFNPENDLALADGTAAYSAPPAAMRIAYDLSTLPLWYGEEGSYVYMPDALHREYYNALASSFTLARPYDKTHLDEVTELLPWGWSMQMRRRLRQLGVNEEYLPAEQEINTMRDLSSRKSSIKIVEALKQRGIDVPEIPVFFTTPDDVACFVNSRERCVIKAPWSGSGKGIMWGKGRVERPLEQFYKGIIRRQGGVVCENFLEGVVEFAMEFRATGEKVCFAGYSLFTTSNAAYNGNILATDSDIEKFLSSYIPAETISSVKGNLSLVLTELLSKSRYTGYLGIDMMIYNDGGKIRLNPCMEMNLRMNMGMVSRIFYDKYIFAGALGKYYVAFFKAKGEALERHENLQKNNPLLLNDGKITSGYLNLSPVTEETSYMAYVVIEPGKSVTELYSR